MILTTHLTGEKKSPPFIKSPVQVPGYACCNEVRAARSWHNEMSQMQRGHDESSVLYKYLNARN